MSENTATDFLVDTADPAALDRTLQQLPGAQALVGGGDKHPNYRVIEGHYVMRVFGNPRFILFACEQQGYCKIVRRLDELT